MSIIIAILQAILQAIAFIIPISESGHAAIFHDFAGRADGSVAVITGVIHIGMALGIFLAMYKTFMKLGKEFFGCGKDIVKKQFSYREASPASKFMLMTLIAFAPMVLWLIPMGKYGFLLDVLRRTGYNHTLLDEGVFLAITGALLFFAAKQLRLGKNRNPVTVAPAAVSAVFMLVLVPVSGLSVIGGVFAIMVLFGVSTNLSYKYALVVSVPTLIGMGIFELTAATYKTGVVAILLGILFAVAVTFVCVRVLKWIIKKHYLQFIALYDMGIGAITAVIGIVQLIVR